MNFQREQVTDAIFEEIEPLLQMHFKEIGHYLDIPLAPDRPFYLLQEERGSLRLYTIRDFDKVLQGYGVFIVRKNPHYSGSLQASQDILFINPKQRQATLGFRFIDWCDHELKREGVQVVYQHVKKAHNFGRMLERLGYEEIDVIYGRRLDLWE